MECIDLNLPDANITYYPSFISPEKSLQLFENLKEQVTWQQDKIKIFGKEHLQPRLTALYANNNKAYSYSSVTMQPLPFTPSLLAIKENIEKIVATDFTTCLLNLYRSGKDSNGWHADNEKELGEYPVIASVSLGASRIFHLKHRYQKDQKAKIILESGSLLIMQGLTQKCWLHQIPKTSKKIGPRINLTFRVIK